MLPSITNLIQEIRAGFRLADVIDILVVGTLVYTAVLWFRKARSRFVILGFMSLVLLYGLARVLDMYLTLLLFQAGITVALVALVVIFQEEIRRAFERIASTGLLANRRATDRHAEMIDAVVESAALLAKQKIGALIVFRGREPLERHITGGVDLDGKISASLIHSIFDPSSAGHDGALIIDGGIARKFAVHLPLSRTPRDKSRLGTRHTAALGLSEHSDALVIVISEERGVISIAQDGKLHIVRSAAELKQTVTAFLREVAPQRPDPLWRRMFVRNVRFKLLSVAIALGAWLALVGLQTNVVAQTFAVPIVFRDVPEGWMVDLPKPAEARVTLSATDRAFRTLEPSRLVISLSMRDLSPGTQRVNVDDSDLERPPTMLVHRIDPRVVTIVAYDTVARELPVTALTTGKLPPGLRLKGVTTRPATIKVIMRSTEVGRTERLRTEPIDLSEITDSARITRRLQIPEGMRLADNEPAFIEAVIDVVRPSPKSSR